MENHQKVVKYIVTNTGREVLVLVDFQDTYYNIKLLDYKLVSISRVAIWNITAKWVTLITDDPQMLREGDL